MKKENEALISEIDKIINSLDRKLIENRKYLKQFSEENRVIKKELSTCIRIKNMVKEGIV